MGTHVVAAKPIEPEPWPPQKPRNCRCVGLGLVTLVRFPKFAFFRNPFVAPRMGLRDHLMTIRVLEHPWGPM